MIHEGYGKIVVNINIDKIKKRLGIQHDRYDDDIRVKAIEIQNNYLNGDSIEEVTDARKVAIISRIYSEMKIEMFRETDKSVKETAFDKRKSLDARGSINV